MTEMNWKTKLKEIEREYDGLPPEPSPSAQKAKRMAEQAAKDRVSRRWVLVRMALVLALSVAIVFWPYYARCGWELSGYFAAITTVALGGLWIAALSWHHRMPVTHALSMIVVVWGMAMAAREILPRAGYAKPDAMRTSWRCTQ
jgi:hypothetical protein